MKIASLLLATLTLVSVTAMAQEEITDSSAVTNSGRYTKFDNGSLSASTGGCSSYGTACSYFTYSIIPSTIEAAKYVASLAPGQYDCDIYYGTGQPTVTTDSGRLSTHFAPALFCKTPPPDQGIVIPPFPAVKALCVGNGDDGFDFDTIVKINFHKFVDGQATLTNIIKAKFVDLDANVKANDIAPDRNKCPHGHASFIDTVRWISSNEALEGYALVELTEKFLPYKNFITGYLKLDESISLSRIVEESRLKGGKTISIP